MSKQAKRFIYAYIVLTIMLSVGVWSIGLNVFSGMTETQARTQGAIDCAVLQLKTARGESVQVSYTGLSADKWIEGCKSVGVTRIIHQ